MTSRTFTIHSSWSRPARIGFLGATSHSVWSGFVDAFEKGLRQHRWYIGSNVVVDYQWAHGRRERYAAIAEKFAADEVDVIVTSGTAPVLAATKVTSSIPIVFAAAGDPRRTRLARQTKARPTNVTGLSNRQTALALKRLAALRSLLPNMERLAFLGNYSSSNVPLEMDPAQRRARRLGIETLTCDVKSASEIAPAIKRLRGKADALYVCTDPLITTNAVTINMSAAAAGLPTMHAFRNYVHSGGLMSYGPDFHTMFGKAANLVDKILRGTSPADLSIQEEKTVELVINSHTARALGVRIPKAVRRRAIVS
jgi:putative ABC transport system substrate-binding protein